MSRLDTKQLLSQSTNNKLARLLHRCDMANHSGNSKDIEDSHCALRAYLGNLVPYATICSFHDDHVIELADMLESLRAEKDDIYNYAQGVLVYLNKKIKEYEQRRNRLTLQVARLPQKRAGQIDEQADLRYEAWTYTDGYYAQRARMYVLLVDCMQYLSATRQPKRKQA